MAENTYVVQEGDTLSKILYEQTGDGSYENYNKVAIANGLANANDIYPGQVINLGDTTSTTDTSTSSDDVIISLDEDEAGDILDVISGNDEKTTESPKNASSNTEKKMVSKETTRTESSSNSNEATTNTSNSEKEKTTITSTTTSSTEKTESTKSSTSVATEKKSTTPTTTSSSSNTKVSTDTTASVYTGTLYEVCCPCSVSAFEPKDSFKKFVVKENAGESFVSIDQRIKKCVNNIETIISNLKSLKNDMGENTGTTEQIEKIISGLSEKENDLKTKESELINACNQVVEYIYKNKSTKTEEATKVAQTISNIKI